MSSYTITITPDDSTRATTTLRVEITGSTTRITELLVRAGDGDGLTAGQLPSVDIDQLLRAITPNLSTAALRTPTGPGTSASTPVTAEVAAVEQPGPVPWPESPDGSVASGSAALRRTQRGRTTTTTNATRRAVRSTKTGQKTTTKTGDAGGRSYRRAPADLAEVLTQTGSPAAVAEHYGVPRHTAQSWLRTMRRRATVTP